MKPIVNAAANPVVNAAVIALINATFEILRTHLNKPPGWKPSLVEWDALLNLIDTATPENVKAQAAAELGVVWPPVP
jgi:hypothetical protein